MVVLAHCCDPFVAQYDNNYSDFMAGALWGSFVRPCVPLFVMISGVLLLPVKMDMGTFYRRRLSRILIPLVAWSVILPVLYYFYLNTGAPTASPTIDMEQHTMSAMLAKFYTFIFNFTYDTIPLWYLYMLVGIYLFLPILSAWLERASKADIHKFFWIWGISMALPYFQMLAPMLGYTGNYGNMGVLGVCDWNAYGSFYYFSGFLGYVVLAFYLVRYPLEWSWRRTLAVALPLYAVGYAITAIGFIMTQKYAPGNYAQLEIIWYFSGINVFMMTFSAFIIMQKIELRQSPLRAQIAGLTFGIYLSHFIVVQVVYDLLYSVLSIPAYLKIPVMTCLVFLVTLGVVWLLNKIPYLRRIIS